MEEIENSFGIVKPRWLISTRILGLSGSVCLLLLLFLAQVHEKFDCDAMHLFMSIDFINGGNREFIRHLQTTLADFYENTRFIWSCTLAFGQQVWILIRTLLMLHHILFFKTPGLGIRYFLFERGAYFCQIDMANMTWIFVKFKANSLVDPSVW